MRPMIMMFLMMTAMLLVACGGDEATPVPQDNNTPSANIPPVPQGTAVGVVEVVTDAVVLVETLIAEEISAQNPPPFAPTLAPVEEDALPVPLVGTLVASETEDPQRGVVFDSIYMVQEGGANNERIVVEIFGDGRAKYNDKEGRVAREDIERLVEAIDSLNYFGIQATFLGPAPRPNEYVYQITVRRGDEQRRINAQDGYIPQPFIQFLAQVRIIAESVAR